MNPNEISAPPVARSRFATASELLSSMRFAISLLCIISIATIIGTVLKQNEPMGNYINQFGPFWSEVFGKIDLYGVYSAWWFLLILGFLVASTSLCLWRNTPKMLKDMRSWREQVRESSLRHFHEHEVWHSTQPQGELLQQAQSVLQQQGYKVKQVEKEDGAQLLVAKRGAANKYGYIFAHLSIIVISIGGLLDSDLGIRMQIWFNGKQPYGGSGLIAKIPEQHRLPLSNPTFRGNTMIPEGASSNAAIIPMQNGVLIQDLPFVIELKKFHIDFYSTGMPKLFASDVVIHDAQLQKPLSATIKVNEPLIYRGYAMYQSSFEDGGSKLKLRAWNMQGGESRQFAMDGEIGTSSQLSRAGSHEAEYTIEWNGFRPFNVENMQGNDVRAVNGNKDLGQQLLGKIETLSGSAAKGTNTKNLKNVGPSVQYKLRDKTGQAREFHNYMQPVEIDGQSFYLAGVRDNPNDAFSYLRIPVDEQHGVGEWMRLRAALNNEEMRVQAAQRYALRAFPQGSRPDADKVRAQLQDSALKSLGIFAGGAGPDKPGGMVAVAQFLQRLPQEEQGKAADIFMKMLQGSLWDLWQVARQKDGLPELESHEKYARYLQHAANALSDNAFYAAPVYLQLDEFKEIKASVLQITRAPGKSVVYLGFLLLTLGVFAMLYIRERRLWLWLKPQEGGQELLLAMSSQRKTFEFVQEFERIKQQLRSMPEAALEKANESQ
ncbi:cytochrome c biogenesis protein ResB [Massilia sp. W12]|uniref:cytochrome c biogenesis protein ResB n=1 Tax=Massilia sp. W12 TaxID=3126507 RepID=UPI0030D5F8F4